MPIQLTTPLDHKAGHDIPNAIYTHIKITSFRMIPDAQAIELIINYGTNIDGVFTKGRTHQRVMWIKNKEEDTINNIPADPIYNNLMIAAVASAESAPLYTEVARSLYEWLINKGHYEGTIV